jgi:hypothetical protein
MSTVRRQIADELTDLCAQSLTTTRARGLSSLLRRRLEQIREHPMTTTFTDEMMRERLTQASSYTMVLLRITDKYGMDGTQPIIWEHGRRNMGLQVDGVMPIVFPVGDETGLAGVCVFVDGPDTVRSIMDGDPAIQAGILSYTVHPCRGFPGSALPAK